MADAPLAPLKEVLSDAISVVPEVKYAKAIAGIAAAVALIGAISKTLDLRQLMIAFVAIILMLLLMFVTVTFARYGKSQAPRDVRRIALALAWASAVLSITVGVVAVAAGTVFLVQTLASRQNPVGSKPSQAADSSAGSSHVDPVSTAATSGRMPAIELDQCQGGSSGLVNFVGRIKRNSYAGPLAPHLVYEDPTGNGTYSSWENDLGSPPTGTDVIEFKFHGSNFGGGWPNLNGYRVSVDLEGGNQLMARLKTCVRG